MTQKFSALEKGMNFLEVVVPEVALTHQVHTTNMVVRQSEQLVAVKDGI